MEYNYWKNTIVIPAKAGIHGSPIRSGMTFSFTVMITGFNIKTIDDESIENQRVLVRVDYNVSLLSDKTISDDLRIKQSLPTITKLLQGNNKIILVSHLGESKEKDPALSLQPVVDDLRLLLPSVTITLLDDFESDAGKLFLEQQKTGEIIILENIRFFKGEENNNPDFAGQLAALADVYVNDAFGVSHRQHASVVGVPKLLPSYAGLLLKKEIEALNYFLDSPKKPFVAVIGGAKISTKTAFLSSLLDRVDSILVGGGLANTFLSARKTLVGKSLVDQDSIATAEAFLKNAKDKNVKIMLPVDVVVGFRFEQTVEQERVCQVDEVSENESIVDIGPETQALFAKEIMSAGAILWNGPMGMVENPQFARGTDFLFYTIAQNEDVYSVVGGGDTIAAIANLDYIDKISWISTGGGAMLEFVETGTLPGIDALKE